jgi:peptide/nickel transport system substrate-binding protein
MRRLIALLAMSLLPSIATAQRWIDSPVHAEAVAAGRLPAIEKRLPEQPFIYAPGHGFEQGRHGGELRIIMGRSQDTRMMAVYGYARLVGYDPNFELKADIVERYDVVENRIFTFKLRTGHRWSDGAAFTMEDFRYWWEDVANNRDLSPSGPPQLLLVDGKPPKVEFLDARTFRYVWDQPNPFFLAHLAGPAPLYIYRPAHYLRQFHQKYAERGKLDAAVRAANARNWSQLHNRLDNLYRNDNPDLPTLEPWMLQTRPPAERFIFTRNPYFHRVDSDGRQLPYIDRVAMNIAESRLISVKTNAGEADLQARNIAFGHYTFLKQSAKRNAFDVRLWETAKGAQVALFPNLNAEDPQWRALNRDPRFRRALSLAINRREINQAIYFGLAVEGHNTVLPKSPLFEPRFRAALFDPQTANRLLDEIGLARRDARGIRLLPDGKPLDIIVETAGEDTEQTDVLQLINDHWREIGVGLFAKPQQREYLRNRVYAGKAVMTIWSGIENGLPNADTAPDDLAPIAQIQMQWPKWGQFVETGGKSGERVDEAPAMELATLYDSWRLATDSAARAAIWRRMLEIHMEQTYTIGILANVPQPVVVSNRLRNVPVKGVYNWEPGSFFGIYRPDSFWFAEPVKAAQVLR